MKKRLLLSAALFTAFACSDEPEPKSSLPKACFTPPESVSALVPFTIDASCSENATAYRWDFGDGNTSTQQSPGHTYNAQGTYTIKLVVTGSNTTADSTTTEVTVGAIPTSMIKSHYFDIDADEVWETGIHKIMTSLHVNNATLTIKPGVVVMFEEDASLNIGTEDGITSARLIAEGSSSQQILFTANSETPEKGHYFGVNFGEGDTGTSSMKHCTMEYGGGSYTDAAFVRINKTSVTLENNTFRHSSGDGIEVGEGGSFASFKNNTFEDIDNSALACTPNAVTTIGQPNDYGADEYIRVNGMLTASSATWKKLEVPYLVSSQLSIGSESGTSLTILPGVKFSMDFGTITVGEYGAKAKLIAEGTAAEPIVFTSHDPNPTAKDWGGIYFMYGNDSTSSLKHCTLEYGGHDFSNWLALVRVEWTSVNINNCTFRNSSPFAIWCNEEGHFESFENNVIDNAEADGIFINSNYVPTIGVTNTITAKRELIVDGRVEKNITWPKFSFPYHVIDWIGVGSEEGNVLTIEPGVVIKMAWAFAFSLGQYDKGGLIADGTPEEPIIFTSYSDTPAPNDWAYIYFGQNTMAGTILDNCIIEYGGANSSVGNIYVEYTSTPIISNCTVRNSGSYGISLHQGANPSISNITFENNVKDDQIDL